MKRLLSILIVLACCSPALAQPFFVRQATSYDPRTMPPVGERFVTDTGGSEAEALATTNLQAILDRIHLTTNTLREDVVLSGGNYYCVGNLHLGCNTAENTARSGGCFMGSGGFAPGITLQGVNSRMGNITRIVDRSTTDADLDSVRDGATIVYGGAHYRIGNFALYAFSLDDSTDYENRHLGTDDYKKKEVGLRLMGMPAGVTGLETASFLHAMPMEFMGYETAIQIQPHTGVTRQGNDTFWQFLYFDTCGTCIHLNDLQSVTHHFYYIQPDIYTSRVFYIQRGGHVISYGGTIRYPNQTLLEIGDGEWDFVHGDIQLNNWKLDDLATEGTILIKLGTPNGAVPRCITLTGSVGGSVGFDAGGAVQGVQPFDKIFIRMVGHPTNVALLNDLSTVDADGNYREKKLKLKFGAVGSNITTGEGKDMIRIPVELNGWRLNDVDAALADASSSGEPAFQLRRKRAGSDVDMLSTPVTFDVNETDADDDQSSQRVINTSNDDVATEDQIYLDCDVAGTDAQLAELELTFRRY